MSIQLVFLRGVMPYGKNRVPMKDLQELLRAQGYPNARTYLHTGNIILETQEDSLLTAEKIQELIHTFIGPKLDVVVRTPEEVHDILEKNPFIEPVFDLKRVFFCMMRDAAQHENLQQINEKIAGTDEKIILSESNAYLYIPGNAGRSKLNNQLVEKQFQTVSTSRNFNTLHKVLTIAASFEKES
ncbi:DUF1697 domain-containing protein [Enterococcus olivae]